MWMGIKTDRKSLRTHKYRMIAGGKERESARKRETEREREQER